jgi:phage head maturation protease
MITAFLNSLASQVRVLVAHGRALHVTEETAVELELIATM